MYEREREGTIGSIHLYPRITSTALTYVSYSLHLLVVAVETATTKFLHIWLTIIHASHYFKTKIVDKLPFYNNYSQCYNTFKEYTTSKHLFFSKYAWSCRCLTAITFNHILAYLADLYCCIFSQNRSPSVL